MFSMFNTGWRPLALLFTLWVSLSLAQETPLSTLPYTPSLEPKFMDRSTDPCQDFYRFACGSWNKLNPIPADQARWDVYGKLANENGRFLWGLLQQLSAPAATRTANEQKIGDFFHACMNEAAIHDAGAKPLQAGLTRIANLKSVDEMASLVADDHRAGVGHSTLFGFGSSQDYDDSSKVIGFATAGGLGLPDRDYYTKTDAKSQEIRQRYVQHVGKMLQLIGESSTDAEADAKAIMSLETALAKARLTRVELRDPYNLKHKLSPDELRRSTPGFDWDVYLKELGAPELDVINVTEPKFFAEVNKQFNEQKLPVWRAYLRWHLVHDRAALLSPQFNDAEFEFYQGYLQGVKQQPPRWKKCTRMVDRELGEALGQVFVAKTFTPETKAEALKMTQQIESEMEADIKGLTWMSDTTKQKALEKLAGIVNKIGYPNKWRDYSSVQIAPDSFYRNVENTRAFESRRDLNKIGKPVDRTEWGMTPPTVNAYFDPQMNDINFPAGVLEPPLFDPKLDSAPNYGNTAATIGHELTHGFDDEGRQFDAHGNLKDWWTEADAKAFEQRVDCVRNQYAGYVVIDDIHTNSKLTAGEDVADLGGTLLAYLAWKKTTAGQTPPSVDGLTPDQRFFVGMAQWACGDERPEHKRQNAITDPHSPDQFRINGVVTNLPQFGEAFGCKPGQPMMRTNSCRVW